MKVLRFYESAQSERCLGLASLGERSTGVNSTVLFAILLQHQV